MDATKSRFWFIITILHHLELSSTLLLKILLIAINAKMLTTVSTIKLHVDVSVPSSAIAVQEITENHG